MCRLSSLLIVGLFSGCIEVHGGAVEAGWDLRFPTGRRTDADGKMIDCAQEGLGEIALALSASETEENPCAEQSYCRFACAPTGWGTTDFAIPEGEYSISLQVLDPTGKALDVSAGITTPAPILRQVRSGEVTSLNVNLIIVDK